MSAMNSSALPKARPSEFTRANSRRLSASSHVLGTRPSANFCFSVAVDAATGGGGGAWTAEDA